ncbi:SDR family oxidoreductase [Williamsia deligens]|uniref:SDR family oxidoreductase n=1 Tax=Williamsia deligens TaxID=321325 RepID=A0ABW3G818_9NOCA|nr:SDR family oxidoreductase [Williamsia deligens]MCP2194218.1 NAD(P)-dependent dehydrogenase, short-chain alcohol dehydrogenase family [Williamsia deligens]
MGTFAVTGSASGMGAAVTARLTADGHRVVGVDRKAADVVADLSTAAGRADATREVLDRVDGHLDGAVMAAGLGPTPGGERLVATVNVLGVIELLTGWRPALEAAGGKAVVLGSNSSTTTPLVPRVAVRRLIAGDVDGAVRVLRRFGPASPAFTYAASKIAVTRWARRTAVTPSWAGAGVNLNILAPGAVMTPLLRSQLEGRNAGQVRQFPIPTRHYGTPETMAAWIAMMLGPAAVDMAGSMVVVDGGTDAHFRSEHWPAPVPLRALARYGVRFLRHDAHVRPEEDPREVDTITR